LLIISFTLVSLSWVIKISQNMEKYNLRLNVVSIKNAEIPYHGLINKTEIYKYQIKKTCIWFLIYLLGVIFGQILTINPPNGARGLILLPVIYIFFSLGLYKLYVLTGKTKLLLFLFVLLSLIYSYLDFTYYQYWMTWIKI